MPWYDEPAFELPDAPGAWEELLIVLLPRLSPRERQVAARRCLGQRASRIADELHITEGAVRQLDSRILQKLDLPSVSGIPISCFRRLWRRYRKQ